MASDRRPKWDPEVEQRIINDLLPGIEELTTSKLEKVDRGKRLKIGRITEGVACSIAASLLLVVAKLTLNYFI